MTEPELVDRANVEVFHIGFDPDPWAWSDWRYAGEDGRFPGRFDDPTGHWRTK